MRRIICITHYQLMINDNNDKNDNNDNDKNDC